jgi:hypothetical protein
MIDYFTSVLLNQPPEEEFERIKSGEEVSSSNIPYTSKYIDMLIKYYELEEEYEKCHILLNYKNNKNSHDSNFKSLFENI